METSSTNIIRTYLTLTLISTLASSLIWGINTLFLLDGGLSIAQAFTANAFFTFGQVIFEVPTGVIADLRGRRLSFLLGTITLTITTFIYYYLWQSGGPFWSWALVSMFLGLGFTFFSGAVEAWLVDALNTANYKSNLESVFAKGQIVNGIAILIGSVAGGVIAQFTSLGVPYIIRGLLLLVSFGVASITMFDIGFKPDLETKPIKQIKNIFNSSIEHGLKVPTIRWMMLAAPFGAGVGIFSFYALQPYLLEVYGDSKAYGIAGLAAAIVAGAQIFGGLIVPFIRKLFKKRTTIIITGGLISSLSLMSFGLIGNFWIAIVIITIWAIVYAAVSPVTLAYLNGLIPSKQRATVLSFYSLMSSVGGSINQPALGKVADVYSYSTAYIVSGVISIIAVPFYFLARKEKPISDDIVN